MSDMVITGVIAGCFSLFGILLAHILGRRHTDKAVERSSFYADKIEKLETAFEVHDLYQKVKDDCEIFLTRKGDDRCLTRRESETFNSYILDLQLISDHGLNGLQQMVNQVMAMEVRFE